MRLRQPPHLVRGAPDVGGARSALGLWRKAMASRSHTAGAAFRDDDADFDVPDAHLHRFRVAQVCIIPPYEEGRRLAFPPRDSRGAHLSGVRCDARMLGWIGQARANWVQSSQIWLGWPGTRCLVLKS